MAWWETTWTPTDGASLDLGEAARANGLVMMGRTVSFPARKTTAVQSVDGDGGSPVNSGYENRTITYRWDARGDDATEFYAAQAALMLMVTQANDVGGELEETPPDGDPVTWDIVGADLSPIETTIPKLANVQQGFEVTFEALPYARLPSVTVASAPYSGTPLVDYDITGIGGDSPALGQLTVTDTATQNRRWIAFGVENHHLDPATDLLYGGEAFTTMNGSSVAVGPSGAHGGGSNTLFHGTVTTSLLEIGKLTGLAHLGLFRVFARVQAPVANAGDATLEWRWAQGGQFTRYTPNASVLVDDDGTWHIADLGAMQLTEPVSGTASWEGRLAVKGIASTDDIYLDWLALIPAEEAFGVCAASTSPTTDAVLFSGRSMMIRHDGAFQQNSGGTSWGPVADGAPRDPLLIPPGDSRLALLHSRGKQGEAEEADTGSTDAISVGIDVTPRLLYLST